LFCISPETDWHNVVTPAIAQQMMVRGLIEHDGAA
jgi:hypothetical protein